MNGMTWDGFDSVLDHPKMRVAWDIQPLALLFKRGCEEGVFQEGYFSYTSLDVE